MTESMELTLNKIALAIGKLFRFWIFGGKWLIIIGILIALGIYIRKKNKGQ